MELLNQSIKDYPNLAQRAKLELAQYYYKADLLSTEAIQTALV